jgi:hypothetical protein
MSKYTTKRTDPQTYSPYSWLVSEERQGVYIARNTIDGRELRVITYPSGEFRTFSEDTERVANVDQMLGCDCEDFENRALAFGRLCRHGSACCAVEACVALSEREAAAAAKKAAWEAEREQRRTAIEASLAADPELVAKYASRRRTADAWCEAAEAVAAKIAA